ncbi:MAG: recombination protein RecR [Patescibacteria group bacterium]|nr:recombination protein RecR [Patescibacteria group bacterium]
MTNSIEKLSELFEKFPGVGKRQAKRFVYFLLRKNSGYGRELSDAILNIKKNIRLCEESFQFFYSERGDTLSPIARNENRDDSKLMIVEKDSDLENIERMGVYDGKYFVLGGSIPVLSKIPNEFIREKELLNIIEKKKDIIKEIILAMSVNPQGENTLEYLQKILERFGIKISVLGRGLSTGTELEYSDKDTFQSAFSNRR